eukprot:scaffold3271_cov181-Amphora_coffeaeformis.AAC.4
MALGIGACMFVFGLVHLNRYFSEAYMLSLLPSMARSLSSVEAVSGYNTRILDDAIPTMPHLRFDWGNLQVTTPLAKRIEAFQSNCSIPMGKLIYRNKFGLGSDLHIWGTVICNAMHIGRRVVTHKPWIYEDQEACRNLHDNPSSMACYFRRAEMLVQEARRQLLRVFGPQGPPENLVTVHIRWGDKGREMKLVSAAQYVNAVRKLLPANTTRTGNIFLATEDPAAVQAFRSAAPPEWNIFVDAYLEEFLPHRNANKYNGNPLMSAKLGGSPGLAGLASLLVAMEANDFVLTTASNWSRVINELRKTILAARLGRELRMIDLRRKVDGKW